MNGFLLILKGVLIGLSVLVPGVSGGTMAIVLGVYDDLIHSIGSFFENKRKHALFLLQVGIGGLLGMVLFSKIIALGLEKFKLPMLYLFLGFVVGGIPVLAKKTKSAVSRKRDYLFCVAGLAVAVLMNMTPPTLITLTMRQNFTSFLLLLVAGFVIAVALILPGISTSFLLLALGLYDTILKAINQRSLFILLPIALGTGIGIICTTKVLENVMNRYPRKTYLMILGFVLGSLVQVFPGIPAHLEILFSILAFAVGLAAITLINHFVGGGQEKGKGYKTLSRV